MPGDRRPSSINRSATASSQQIQQRFSGGITIGRGSIFVLTGAVAGSNSPLGSNGTIAFGTDSTNGRLVVTGGPSNVIDRPIFFNSGNGVIETPSNTAQLFLDGPITGPGGFTKAARGSRARLRNKTYTGLTLVEKAALLEGSIEKAALHLRRRRFDTISAKDDDPHGRVIPTGSSASQRETGTGHRKSPIDSGELHMDSMASPRGNLTPSTLPAACSSMAWSNCSRFPRPADNSDVFRSSKRGMSTVSRRRWRLVSAATSSRKATLLRDPRWSHAL